MGPCDKDGCTGDLIVRFGRTGKRFLGCSNYPKCNNSYPLPQKGKVMSLDKVCPECGKPMVKTIGTRYAFEMCVDMNCKTNFIRDNCLLA